jgi:hypothetical protein
MSIFLCALFLSFLKVFVGSRDLVGLVLPLALATMINERMKGFLTD